MRSFFHIMSVTVSQKAPDFGKAEDTQTKRISNAKINFLG